MQPKARLKEIVNSYKGIFYKETSDASILLGKIGIPKIREECPHFDSWLARLEKLGNSCSGKGIVTGDCLNSSH